MLIASPLLVDGELNWGTKMGLSPLLLKIDPESRKFASRTEPDTSISAFFSPKLPVSPVRLALGAPVGDFVMILIVAKMPFVPYNADDGPRMISICFTRFMSIGNPL